MSPNKPPVILDRCPLCGKLSPMRAVKHREGGIGWLCRDCGMVVPDRLMLAYSNKRMKVMGVAKL